MKKFIDIIKETEEKNINTPKVISINGYESVYAEVLRQMIPGSLNVLINTFEYGVRSFFRGLIIEKAVRQGEAVACYYPWKQTLSDVRLMMASFLNIPRIEQIYVYDDDSWRRIVKEVKPELFDVPIYVECSETMNVDDIITDIEKKHAELGINTFFIQNLSGFCDDDNHNTVSCFKKLASRLGVTIISMVFSFFDYENSEGIMSKRPRLSHIDWYGNAASVADSVIGIFEPAAIGVKVDNVGNDMDGMVEVLTLKSPCGMPYSFWVKQGKGILDLDRGDFDINL